MAMLCLTFPRLVVNSPRLNIATDQIQDDFFNFQRSHFSAEAVAAFGSTFTNQPNAHDDEGSIDVWEEEDSLGYYEDGVKRTLTDEQIEIFRHSELEAIRKKTERESEIKTSRSSDESMDLSDGTSSQTPRADTTSNTPPTTASKNKKKKGAKRGRPEPKPDLRKRTWDVVEKGLDTLDYD